MFTCCVPGEPVIGAIEIESCSAEKNTFPEVVTAGEKATTQDRAPMLLGTYVAGNIFEPAMGTIDIGAVQRAGVATYQKLAPVGEKATADDAAVVVMNMFDAYDAGKFFGTERERTAAEFFSNDFSVDWSVPGKSGTALKVYEGGSKAALDWFLAMKSNLLLKDFVREAFLVHGNGTIIVPVSFTPQSVTTGKKASHVEKELQVWQVQQNGKISHCKVLFPDITMHAILSGEEPPMACLPKDDVGDRNLEAALAVVQNMFKGCGGGNLLGVATEFFSEEFSVDWSVPGKSGTALTVYEGGANAVLDWVLSMRDHVILHDFAPQAFLAYGNGYVVTPVSFVPESVTTGKKADYIEKEIQVWKVKNGKICHCKVYFPDTTMHDIVTAELEISLPLGGKSLGLNLVYRDLEQAGIKIKSVKPTGAVAEYNKNAAKPVAPGMIIMEFLGIRGTAKEILDAIKGNKISWVTLKLS